MKNLFKLGLVVFGFALATSAVSDVAKAADIKEVAGAPGGGCYGAGACGTTAGGTKLNGSWRE
jgi:hypothetical protein